MGMEAVPMCRDPWELESSEPGSESQNRLEVISERERERGARLCVHTSFVDFIRLAKGPTNFPFFPTNFASGWNEKQVMGDQEP